MLRKVCKICRREGQKLYLKGQKCYSEKCSIERRPYIPGQHGKVIRMRKTDYFIRLREKQKLKRIYFVDEKQFARFFKLALKHRGNTGAAFLQLLERRLDNVVYRAGFACSRRSAKQLVSHGHVKVNGGKVNIPSYLVNIGDVISPKRANGERGNIDHPTWLEVDPDRNEARVVRLPERQDIDYEIKESLIVEFYSR